MSKQEININIRHSDYKYISGGSHNNLKKSVYLYHNNTINRLWYNLYKIDKIIFTDDPFHKAINIFEEVLDNNNNYLEYTKYKLSNPVSNSINNYYDFQNYIIDNASINFGTTILILSYYYNKKNYLTIYISGLNLRVLFKENIISQQQDIVFLNNSSTLQQKDITILKDNKIFYLNLVAVFVATACTCRIICNFNK